MNRSEFALAVLAAGGWPTTDPNVDVLVAAMVQEGSQARWNPLDTTWEMPGAEAFNDLGDGRHVWNFPDAETGVQATVNTLRLAEYGAIVAAFEDSDGQAGATAWDASPWGTHGVASAYGGIEENNRAAWDVVVAGTSPAAPTVDGPPIPEPAPSQPSGDDVQLPLLTITNPGPGVRVGAVATVQAKLALLGYGAQLGPCGADGRYGEATASAVTQFQRDHGLRFVDGKTGPETWPAIIDA